MNRAVSLGAIYGVLTVYHHLPGGVINFTDYLPVDALSILPIEIPDVLRENIWIVLAAFGILVLTCISVLCLRGTKDKDVDTPPNLRRKSTAGKPPPRSAGEAHVNGVPEIPAEPAHSVTSSGESISPLTSPTSGPSSPKGSMKSPSKNIQDATGKFLHSTFGVFPKLMKSLKAKNAYNSTEKLRQRRDSDGSLSSEMSMSTINTDACPLDLGASGERNDRGGQPALQKKVMSKKQIGDASGETSAETDVDGDDDSAVPVSDHVAADVTKIGLTDNQLNMVEEAFNDPLLFENVTMHALAKTTDVTIDKHLIYRYYTAVDWATNYHGTKVPHAITETINWRNSFRISQIKRSEVAPLVKRGFAYTASNFDKKGRSIIYVKFGRNMKAENEEMYLKLMLYTVER